MEDRTRRRIVGGMGALAATSPMFWVKSAQAQTSFKPEKGAKLRVLRWKRFVQADEDCAGQHQEVRDAYGIECAPITKTVKTCVPGAVAANVGAGPDIIVGCSTIASYPKSWST